jgi:hypothetical protein
MFWIVGGSGLMLGLQKLGGNPVVDAIVRQLRHTDWQGLRFYDLIWPAFMLMTGMSVPFSYAKRSRVQTHREIFLRVLRRCLLLFLLGSLRESVRGNAPYLVELSSALQPVAIAYFCAFLMVRRSWRFQAAAGALILAGYALLLAFVPAAGIPAGSYQRNANLVWYVDMAIIGRTLPEGWGTALSGRTFVTNGPMLFLEVAGKEPGDEIRLTGPRSVKVKARAQSLVPMTVLELIVNGEVKATAKPSADGAAIEINHSLRIDRSSWIAARVWGDRHRLVVNDPKVFAHTSPVYCYLGGQRILFPEDARIVVAWINRLIQDVVASPRFSSEGRRNEVVDLFRRAQRYYQEIR